MALVIVNILSNNCGNFCGNSTNLCIVILCFFFFFFPQFYFSTAENSSAVISALLSALGSADLWSTAQNCHEMFERGGYFYEKAANDLGPLKQDQHLTLHYLPNKVSFLCSYR